MAFGTKCGKCGGGFFEVKTIEPAGGSYKLIAVQCTSCGTPFGLTTYYDPGVLLKEQQKKIENLERQLSSIEHYVHQIANTVCR